jgi:xanthine dehydrogenase accessory factor
MTEDILEQVSALRRRGEPFALATVVRAEAPTSAKPGAKAIVLGDGTVSGWVGGACAEPVVTREALKALRDGRPRLIGLVGDGGGSAGDILRGPGGREGLVEYPMTCHSGGTLEIYVEPYLPRPLLLLVGHGPVIETLATLGRASGHTVMTLGAEATSDNFRSFGLTTRASVVVATHGDLDEAVLEHVLVTETGYVSLVASRRRATAIVERLRQRGVAPDGLARVKAPAGLDIGAITPEEIAVSILAEIIQHHRSRKTDWTETGAAPPAAGSWSASGDATDPICGMTVEVATAKYRSDVSGRHVYFCCRRCQEVFDQDPDRYLAATS